MYPQYEAAMAYLRNKFCKGFSDMARGQLPNSPQYWAAFNALYVPYPPSWQNRNHSILDTFPVIPFVYPAYPDHRSPECSFKISQSLK